jgi:signal transduction histidine kinase
MVTFGAALHYADILPLLSLIADRSPVGLSTRQGVERVLLLVPVLYATFAFGARGGLLTLVVVGAIELPRSVSSSVTVDHAVPETVGMLAVGGLLIIVLTQQQREIEAQVDTRRNLDYFVHRTLTAQEDERKRVALELHDETAQGLILGCRRLDQFALSRKHEFPIEAATELDEVRTLLVRTLEGLRRMTHNLRPRVLDDLGLAAAIDWLADEVSEQYDFLVRVDIGETLPELPRDTQLVIFRIAQEALTNAGRHSGASRAVISLHSIADGIVRLIVTDNGRGFETRGVFSRLEDKGKLGLLGIRERARLLGGNLTVRSRPGRGTTLIVALPIDRTAFVPRDE